MTILKNSKEHDYFDKKEFILDWKIFMRQPALTFWRVMWYFSAFQTNFNQWKKSEWCSRKYFQEDKTLNSKFCENYDN